MSDAVQQTETGRADVISAPGPDAPLAERQAHADRMADVMGHPRVPIAESDRRYGVASRPW